jgi:hypothetical protein
MDPPLGESGSIFWTVNSAPKQSSSYEARIRAVHLDKDSNDFGAKFLKTGRIRRVLNDRVGSMMITTK